MKSIQNLFCLVGSLLILACNQPEKTVKQEVTQDSTDKQTQAVRNEQAQQDPVTFARTIFSATENKLALKGLDSLSVKYDCSGERSGTITYYAEKGKLLAIVHSYAEYSHYNALDKYYLKDDKLVFAVLNGTSWSFDSGPEGSTKDNITETRVYMKDEQLFKCLEKKFTTRSQSATNPRSEDVPSKEVSCSKTFMARYQYIKSMQNGKRPACPQFPKA